MLNHSCDPNISKYFVGSNVVAVANRKIFKGQEVCENYYPSYTHIDHTSRQKWLKKQYKFECECTPCVENFPPIGKYLFTKTVRPNPLNVSLKKLFCFTFEFSENW